MIGVRESLLGQSYFYHRSLIKKSKGWSLSNIREYQDTRFRRLVRRYGDAITQKEDYQRYLRRYTRWNVPLLTHTVRTGGHQVSLFASRPTHSRAARKSALTSLTSGPRWDTNRLTSESATQATSTGECSAITALRTRGSFHLALL